MYTVKIRDHIMIAHSLKSEAFGPAQNVHGATYVVDAFFRSNSLNDQNVVIDISLATDVLKKTLEPLNYQNLDDLPEFKGQLTTTEYLARYIHDGVQKALATSFHGSIEVILGESHIAWAGYRGEP